MSSPKDINEKLAAVYELSREMTLSANIERISNSVLDIAQKALNFDNCALFLIDETSNEIYTKAQRGYSKDIDEIRLNIDYYKGVIASAARIGKAIYVPDVTKDGRYIRGVPGGKSELAVPLKIGGNVIGVLDVESKKIDAFSDEDQELLSCLASQTALAIQNASNFEELNRGLGELRVLFDIASTLTSTIRLNELLPQICEKLKHLMGINTFYIALYDESKDEIHFEHRVDEGKLQKKVILKLSEKSGLTGWIIRNKKPLLIKDSKTEQGKLPVPPITLGKVPRSWLGVPLIVKDKVIGVMTVQSYEPHAFDEQDFGVLSIMANQVAIVLENAKLFNEIENKTRQLSILLDAGLAFSSSLDPIQIIQNLAEKITKHIEASFCIVTQLDEQLDELIVKSAFAIRELNWNPNIGDRISLSTFNYLNACLKDNRMSILRPDKDGEEFSKFSHKILQIDKINSMLVAPLISGKRKMGLSIIGEMRNWNRSPFSAEKMDLCHGITDRAAIAIDNAMLHEQLKENHAFLKAEVEERYVFGNIIGNSPKMREVYTILKRIKDSSVRVLIEGESGTGKEIVARALHYEGARRNNRFVAVDCSAIPETLFESELFGHKKGAFTDARQDKKGLIEEADGGTLFLDEVGNINLNVQAKLLRVLQQEEVMRLGENKPRKVNVRVIAATSRKLEDESNKGKFRKDLLYRLNVFTIQLPPLKDRLEDVPLLADHFLKKYCKKENKAIDGFSPKAMEMLMKYDYSRNNVRELENIIERAVVMERSQIIKPQNLLLPKMEKTYQIKAGKMQSLEETEKNLIIETLKHTNWKKKEACSILGISRPTLNRKLKQLRISR